MELKSEGIVGEQTVVDDVDLRVKRREVRVVRVIYVDILIKTLLYELYMYANFFNSVNTNCFFEIFLLR